METMQQKMTATLQSASEEYEHTYGLDGYVHSDCGDFTARLLRNLPLNAVLLMADNAKGVPPGTHAKKYEHLNHAAGTPNDGAKRMNAGNVIRNAIRKETMQ